MRKILVSKDFFFEESYESLSSPYPNNVAFLLHCYPVVHFKYNNTIFQVHSKVKSPINNLLIKNNCLNAHYKSSSAFKNEDCHSINDEQLFTIEVHKYVPHVT